MYRVKLEYRLKEIPIGYDAAGKLKKPKKMPPVHLTQARIREHHPSFVDFDDQYITKRTPIANDDHIPPDRLPVSPRKRRVGPSQAPSASTRKKVVKFSGAGDTVSDYAASLEVNTYLRDHPTLWAYSSVGLQDDAVGEDEYLSSRVFVVPLLEYSLQRGIVWPGRKYAHVYPIRQCFKDTLAILLACDCCVGESKRIDGERDLKSFVAAEWCTTNLTKPPCSAVRFVRDQLCRALGSDNCAETRWLLLNGPSIESLPLPELRECTALPLDHPTQILYSVWDSSQQEWQPSAGAQASMASDGVPRMPLFPRKFVRLDKHGRPTCLPTGLASGCSGSCRHCEAVKTYLTQSPLADNDLDEDDCVDDNDDGEGADTDAAPSRVDLENEALRLASEPTWRFVRAQRNTFLPYSQRTIPYAVVADADEQRRFWNAREGHERPAWIPSQALTEDAVAALDAMRRRAAPYFQRPPTELVPKVPASGMLSCCPQCTAEGYTENHWQPDAFVHCSGILYTSTGSIPVTIYKRFCYRDHPYYYDGLEDAVFRVSETVLYTYELMAEMYNLKRAQPTSFKAFWQSLRDRYAQFKAESIPTRQDLSFAFLAFVALLRIDYDASFGFLSCSHCAATYNESKKIWVVMDGISAGIRQSAAKGNPLRRDPSSVVKCSPLTTAVDSRLYIAGDSKARDLLRALARDGLTPTNFKYLCRFLTSARPALRDVLKDTSVVQRKNDRYVLTCDKLKNLFHDLASLAPVQLLLPPVAVPVFESLVEANFQDAVLEQQFTALAPVVAAALHSLAGRPTSLVRLCQDLSRMTTQSLIDNPEAESIHAKETQQPVPSDDLLAEGLYIAGGKMRDVPSYSVDSLPQKAVYDGSNPCSKRFSQQRTLIPGTMNMFCPHGVSHGFSFMMDSESARTPFALLLMAGIPADAEVHVCYDDCCKLATYVLMREPALFRRWRWYIDRLHFKDHVSCSRALDVNLHPDHTQVNTEICEQRHSLMNKLRGQLAGMSQYRAAFYLRHFLFCRNVSTGRVCVRQKELSEFQQLD